MKTFHFLKTGLYATILSVVAICAMWFATFCRGGFNIGVDFKSGLSMTIALPQAVDTTKIEAALAHLPGLQVQQAENNQVIIRAVDTGAADFQESTEKAITKVLAQHYGKVEVLASDFVGAEHSKHMVRDSVLLVAGSLAAILLYLWFRFEIGYAWSVIISTVHDVLFLIGYIGCFQLEVNAATVAAVLTILGYSLNDTIVTFDRIRENRAVEKRMSTDELIDYSVTQVLSRTLITSFTTLLSIIAIAVLAMGSVKLFAIEMIVGIIVGTYSSLFVASISLKAFFDYQKKQAAANKRVKLSRA